MQKFHHGDLIRLADDLGPSMSHFPSGGEAIVIGSYKDAHGGDNTNSYTLFIPDHGKVSWYHEEQLTLIAKGQLVKLLEWEQELETRDERESDIDWIFAHATYVIEKWPGTSVSALGKLLGIGNMWGARGEGFTFYANAVEVMSFATPYLESSDKDGFLKAASR